MNIETQYADKVNRLIMKKTGERLKDPSKPSTSGLAYPGEYLLRNRLLRAGGFELRLFKPIHGRKIASQMPPAFLLPDGVLAGYWWRPRGVATPR